MLGPFSEEIPARISERIHREISEGRPGYISVEMHGGILEGAQNEFLEVYCKGFLQDTQMKVL